MNTPTETPKRYQCRHIFTDGHRCGSPCLRSENLCYYHHTTRRPAQNPHTRHARRSTFELPLPEDRSAIQHSIGQVLQRIAANDIDPRRAGLLLYGLQIASLNLPKQQPTAKSAPETVEEITTDPELGLLAPPAEVGHATKRKSAVAQLLEKILEDEAARKESAINETAQNETAQSAILPTLQATAEALAPRLLSFLPDGLGIYAKAQTHQHPLRRRSHHRTRPSHRTQLRQLHRPLHPPRRPGADQNRIPSLRPAHRRPHLLVHDRLHGHLAHHRIPRRPFPPQAHDRYRRPLLERYQLLHRQRPLLRLVADPPRRSRHR